MAKGQPSGQLEVRHAHYLPLGVAFGVMLLSGGMGIENVLSRRALQRERQRSLERMAQTERVMSLSQDLDLAVLEFHLSEDPSKLLKIKQVRAAWPEARARMAQLSTTNGATDPLVAKLLQLTDRHLTLTEQITSHPSDRQELDREVFNIHEELRTSADRLLAREEDAEHLRMVSHVRRSEWLMALGGAFFLALAFLLLRLAQAFARSHRLRVAAEASLAQAQFERNQAITAAGVGIFRRNLTTQEITLDDRGGSLFGYAGAITVSFDELLLRMLPEDRERVQCALSTAISTRGTYAENYRIALPDAPLRWIQAHGHWMPGIGAVAPSLVGLVRDMTKEVERERELETLRGLLPICAWCKRIRTDTGYWDQVETYFARRDQVHFTHSICPTCRSNMEQESHET
jgi:PAS domain-containing protein